MYIISPLYVITTKHIMTVQYARVSWLMSKGLSQNMIHVIVFPYISLLKPCKGGGGSMKVKRLHA